MLAVFLAGPLFGLPLIGRYVRTPAVLLALFYGLAVMRLADAAARGARPPRLGDRRRGRGALSVAYLPWHVKLLHGRRRTGSTSRAPTTATCARRREATAVRSAFDRCGTIATADHRPIPHLRWWIERRPGQRRAGRRRRRRAARACCCSPAARARCSASTATKFPRVDRARRLPARVPQRVLARARRARVSARVRPMRVAVLGAGNGGVASAFDFAQHGHEVVAVRAAGVRRRTWSRSTRPAGSRASGDLEGFAPIRYAGHDAGEAMAGAELVRGRRPGVQHRAAGRRRPGRT